MRKFLHRLIKFLAYSAAGIIILLAIAVGLFRLFLPKLPEYQDELKAWASNAIGMQVEFSGMDARWGLSGPELNFYDAELIRDSISTPFLAAEEVSIGVALLRLLRDRTVVVDRILVRDTTVEFRERADGQWWIQGMTFTQLTAMNENERAPIGDVEIVGEDIELQLIRLGDQRPTSIDVSRLTALRDEARIAIDANVRLPESMGRQLDVSASGFLDRDPGTGYWDLNVEARGLELPGWTSLVKDYVTPLESGSGFVDISLRVESGGISQVAGEFAFANVAAAVEDNDVFDTAGQLEYRVDQSGWLLALNEFVLQSSNGSWPESSLRLEVGTSAEGSMEMVDLRADYANIADAVLVQPWLTAEQRSLLTRYAPEGVFRNLSLTAAGLQDDSLDFTVSTDFEGLGFAAWGNVPGVRNLGGRIRADRSGGLADIDAVDVSVSLPDYLGVPVPLDDVYGTLIWRQSGERITVLSDSIVLRNAEVSTNSNVELILTGADGPVIDLSTTFSVTDIAGVKRFIPDRVLKPKLYDWFQAALVKGQIHDGRVRLYGPLRAFPFDNEEGRLLIEANVRQTEFRYLPRWPAAELIDVDVVLDGMHLFTRRNESLSTGNSIVNASVDIPDLREPVLTIQGLATGTLDTMRRFGSESPLARFFAGQLDFVEVSGDATLALDLMVPIKRAAEFEVSAKIRSAAGTVQLPGLQRPITDLAGAVTIEKDSVSSEDLRGRFTDREVSFTLLPAPAELAGYSIVLNALGSISAEGLAAGVGLPAAGFISGETEYTVSVFFPRAERDGDGSLLAIEASSDLIGLSVDLPAPFAKSAEVPLAFAGQMLVGRNAERIDTSGGVDDDLRWQVGFARDDNNTWDLDRGVLSFGDASPPAAETRGLHIRGNASDIVLEDWLALRTGEGGQSGVLERLRSIDITVGNLRLFGQHLVDHRVRLDRSARDWLVQFEGDSVEGAVFVPYDLPGARPIVMDMERLKLPGDPSAAGGPPSTAPDPRGLPAFSVRAREFAIGERYFGALEAEISRVDDGLESRTLLAVDDTFEIVANGSWLHVPDDPLGSVTSITANLTSTDVGTTLGRLGYTPGLVGNELSAMLDLSWSGGPGTSFLETLDGNVRITMGVGQLDEVEPGAGRVLGLVSIVALPRRLSLDFSDVFEKGFGFDKIEGDFRLEDGEAYTCNLSLEAPAADIAIIGRASLVNRDYDQAALIGANVGNVLPVAAAGLAGPQAAVAVLIFSQIFKKPLQGMGQVYYSIRGPWDTPDIEQANAERFAATGRSAGCVSEAATAE